VQHLALTKYVAILALAPVNRAWGAAQALCSGSSEAITRPSAGAAGGYPRRTRRATALLATLAVLDVSSYFMHCVGALRVVRGPLLTCRDRVKLGLLRHVGRHLSSDHLAVLLCRDSSMPLANGPPIAMQVLRYAGLPWRRWCSRPPRSC